MSARTWKTSTTNEQTNITSGQTSTTSGLAINMNTASAQGGTKSNQISFTNTVSDKTGSLMIITLS